MFYDIKVISPTGEEIIIDGKPDGTMADHIKRVYVKIDTVEENQTTKATNVLNKVEIELQINETTNGVCKDLMSWSLKSFGDDIYRTVHMDIYNTKKLIRSFDLKEMFVEDCEEEYSKEAVDNGIFIIKLIQQSNKQKDFLHDVNQL